MRYAFERELAAEVKACPPGDAGLLAFEVRNQMRNRMGHNPLKVYTNEVACFTPGVSRDFWTLAAGIPYSRKWNFRLYFEIFRNHFPEALSTPFCSMGESPRTGRRPSDPRMNIRHKRRDRSVATSPKDSIVPEPTGHSILKSSP